MKTVIFFDFFGVLCTEIAPVWFEKYYAKEEAARIKNEIFVHADIGEINEEETFDKMSKVTGIPSQQIKKEWKELIHINEELVAFLKELKKEHSIYLLSNAIGTFLRKILEENDLYQLFEKVYISSDIKKIKPNVEFYEYVLKDLGIVATEAVMIDDNPENIKGAEKAGISGIVYKNNESLFLQLKNYV